MARINGTASPVRPGAIREKDRWPTLRWSKAKKGNLSADKRWLLLMLPIGREEKERKRWRRTLPACNGVCVRLYAVLCTQGRLRGRAPRGSLAFNHSVRWPQAPGTSWRPDREHNAGHEALEWWPTCGLLFSRAQPRGHAGSSRYVRRVLTLAPPHQAHLRCYTNPT